jgi:hypothetical protein
VAVGEAQSVGRARVQLLASVSPAGVVVVQDKTGRRVVTLHAGAYALTVRDRSRLQNFHLTGSDPSINPKTGIKFVGTVTWKLRLFPGGYRYQSDRRPKSGRSFRVVS